MTKAEIIKRLTELGIEFSGSATKAELEELLQRAEESAAAGAPEDAADSPAPNQTAEEDDNAEPSEGGEDAPDAPDEPEETPKEDPAPKPAPDTEPETVKVLVGPNGEAGRIIVRRIAIDTRTPGVITMREYNSLRRRYDLRIVEPEDGEQ